jgi:predicted ATPase
LPETATLRGEEIKLQVGLVNALMHTRGHAAPETKAALDQARSVIERAEALGEPPEDPLLLLSVLYGFWVASYAAFNGDVMRELAAQLLALAEKQGATVALMLGHRLMGTSLMLTGDIVEGRAHNNRAIALYDPQRHRPLATRFAQDIRVAILTYQSLAMWLLGYPEAALSNAGEAMRDAREIGHAATLMHALLFTSFAHLLRGEYAAAASPCGELAALANDKGALFWKVGATTIQGTLSAMTDRATDAVRMITAGIAERRLTGATLFLPLWLVGLTRAHAGLGQFDAAWRCIHEAITVVETTKESWCEAEVYRMAGEIALMSPEPDMAKAEGYFDRALTIARRQQAKSWELRAAMSMARLWRDQGKRQQARDLLAPVYGWFTEGFDTLDLKQAKALLEDRTA